ncbi:MAG: sulfotransferase [Myxococcota bacterium]|nr:sulfotransferase [Myxococcota bacterium]
MSSTSASSFDFDALHEEASRRTSGLGDFGDPIYEEALRRLLRSLDTEARLHDTGRSTLRQRIVQILENRLRAEEAFRRNPEIADEEIRSPFAIVGLARTGTTMLHRTIASDDRMFALLWWESRNPAPLLEPFDSGQTVDPRILSAEAEVAAMLAAVPELAASHPFDAQGPDEEIMLMEHCFYSTNTEAFAHVPGYSNWLDEQDQRPGYEYLERLLKLLQWNKKQAGSKAQRWVLKTPHHLGFMPAFFDVFPDLKVIQTHRDPVETIPSFASLVHNCRIGNTDALDPRITGDEWGGRMKRALASCMDFRESREDRFIDVDYEVLCKDPLSEVRRIYEFVGLEFTTEAEAAMNRWAAENTRDKRPVHEYSLETYGFTEEQIASDFARYRERFSSSR